MKLWRDTFKAGIAAAAMALLPVSPAAAAEAPGLQTNQGYVEESLAAHQLDPADPEAVLAFVLASLPDKVKVYPTENYFYFGFVLNGIRWAGNLRFDVETRDAGKVHMTYFKEFTQWQRDDKDVTVIWDATRGVTVKKVADLAYTVTFRDRTVTFQLNDLRSVKPPEGVVREGEKYLGPMFDESGIRFFLVFDPVAKVFMYVLDETVPTPDEFFEAEEAPGVSIGRRTGFAFIKDKFAPRKILVGVSAANTATNNYLDGPFDQLPDNFLEGNALLDAILAVSPELAGTLDRFGNSEDDTVRYLIAPYMQYEEAGELSMFADCADSEPLPFHYACFSLGPYPDDGGSEEAYGGEGNPPPDEGQAEPAR